MCFDRGLLPNGQSVQAFSIGFGVDALHPEIADRGAREYGAENGPAGVSGDEYHECVVEFAERWLREDATILEQDSQLGEKE